LITLLTFRLGLPQTISLG